MANKIRTFECAVADLSRGISLIEASAGTGKTYAIAMLVLRFVGEKNIPVDKILVVTFTVAATEELRGRIRAKLVEGRDGLLGKLTNPDPTMQQWLDQIESQGIQEQVLARLTLGLAEIDLLPVFTIHGFCQRILVEQALESGQLFESELMTDVERIRLEVVEDYWRKHLYSLDILSCSYILSNYSFPEALWQSISKAPGADHIIPDYEPFADTHTTFIESYKTACLWWKQNGATLVESLDEIYNEGKFKSDLNVYFDSIIDELQDFFTGKSKVYTTNLQYLLPEVMIDYINGRKVKKAVMQDFVDELDLPDSVAVFLADAEEMLKSFRMALAMSIGEELDARLAQNGRMSFDALINRLADALDGQSGTSLKRLVDEHFKVALIDEFQDTDAKQWKIFHSFFGNGNHSLYLIGDPKQAIYKFRGADIFSYFNAKSKAQHHLTLKENYRSHPYLVEEVNELFGKHDEPFLFDKSRMDYHDVAAAKGEDALFIEDGGKRHPAVIYGVLEEGGGKEGCWTKGDADNCFLQFMAAEISRLLHPHTDVSLTKNEDSRSLQARDIAILVRSHRQAEACRQILSRYGFPVVAPSKNSVFETTECRDLYLLLDAVSAPGNLRTMKAAMSISWFGISGDQLEEIFHDDKLLDEWTFRFMQYHGQWGDNGFLAMINTLLHKERLLLRIGSEPYSERRITNILHLSELLQQVESDERYGMSQLIQWLGEAMDNSSAQEAAELRLESDDDAIRIVTMHGSKGLEYPVVFCPYLWDRSGMLKKEKAQINFYDDDKGALTLDLGSDDFETHKELALQEELAEDMRLLYVALTRAAAKLYVFWADIKSVGIDSFDSALGHILFDRKRVSKKEQDTLFNSRRKKGRVDVVTLTSEGDEIAPYCRKDDAVTLAPITGVGASLQTDWQVSSFSALSALSEEEQLPLPPAEEIDEPILVTDLPAGAGFGNVVHDTLEHNNFNDLADGKLAEESLLYSCIRYGVTADLDKLQQLLCNVVQTPLFAEQPSLTLADLDVQKTLKEMEFYFSLGKIDTAQLNTLLAGEPTVSNLSQRHLQGYLTGFIDLVFEHDGRFYVVDYKTNNLGDYSHNYRQESLIHAMAAHNYGLQYWIYTAVLHGFLQKAISDYSYDSHFGGVLYLFVRGMNPQKPASGIFTTRPAQEKLESLLSILEGSR